MRCSLTTLVISLVMVFTWCSAAKPLYRSDISDSPIAPNLHLRRPQFLNEALNTGSSPTKDHHSINFRRQSTLVKRAGINPLASCKIIQRHQSATIWPSILTVNALVHFWQKVALEAIHQNAMVQPKTIFTFTSGRLQATFSSLGSGVPWPTVGDIAMMAVESVRTGWLDTFDAVYEELNTGYTLWVSLRVLER